MAHEIEEGLDGLYSVCIFNAEKCSDEEIQSVFGEFGNIVRINRSNNITFVRYKTLEEATQCYECMQGNSRFNVKPAKNKGGSNNSGRGGRFGDMNRNDGFRGRKLESGGSGDFGRPSSATSKQAVPKLIPFPFIDPAKEDASKRPPSAKMVIIGNLNPKLGQNNIYQMCTKAHAPPLHVAMKTIKRPPYANMSFAIVYVRDETEVDNIVTSLNNLKINDYKLVASSVEKLTEEGKNLLSVK